MVNATFAAIFTPVGKYITMLLQCPITLADTYRLKCADLSGIRLP